MEMITTQLTLHNRRFFVPTSRISIPPSKLGKTRRRLARRLVGRQVCRLGAWEGGGGACMRNEPQLWALTQCIAVVANRVRMRRARHAYIGGSLTRSARAVRAQCNYLGVRPYQSPILWDTRGP